jgi:DNA-binding response OmpR family regulator
MQVVSGIEEKKKHPGQRRVTVLAKQPVLLVVDDEESLLKLLRVNLSLEGYKVITAADGMAALEMFREHQPDLCILDIMMPGLDGFGVLKAIREQSSVPVIMLTASGEVEHLRETLLCGADDYVMKPFSLEELAARIRAKLPPGD